MDLELRASSAGDVDFVRSCHVAADAAPFISRWSEADYRATLEDPDQAHLLIVGASGPVGFVLLAGLLSEHRGIELRRIVVSEKGQGVGQLALQLVLEHAFTTLHAHRVWLDVKVHNQRAQRAYHAVGFKDEGVLRDTLMTHGKFESLIVMSILEHEWRTTSPTD